MKHPIYRNPFSDLENLETQKTCLYANYYKPSGDSKCCYLTGRYLTLNFLFCYWHKFHIRRVATALKLVVNMSSSVTQCFCSARRPIASPALTITDEKHSNDKEHRKMLDARDLT